MGVWTWTEEEDDVKNLDEIIGWGDIEFSDSLEASALEIWEVEGVAWILECSRWAWEVDGVAWIVGCSRWAWEARILGTITSSISVVAVANCSDPWQFEWKHGMETSREYPEQQWCKLLCLIQQHFEHIFADGVTVPLLFSNRSNGQWFRYVSQRMNDRRLEKSTGFFAKNEAITVAGGADVPGVQW